MYVTFLLRVYAVLNSGDNIDDVSDTLLHMSTPGTDNALEDTSMSLQEKLVNVVGLSEEVSACLRSPNST